MRIFDRSVCVILAGLVMCFGMLGAASAASKYRSAQDALDQGIGAFNGGYYEIAIPALEHAADAHLFLNAGFECGLERQDVAAIVDPYAL
jgi:hypothetical protein